MNTKDLVEHSIKPLHLLIKTVKLANIACALSRPSEHTKKKIDSIINNILEKETKGQLNEINYINTNTSRKVKS